MLTSSASTHCCAGTSQEKDTENKVEECDKEEINAIRVSDIVHVRVLPRKRKSSNESDLDDENKSIDSDEDDRQLRTHLLLVRYAIQCEKHRLRMKSCMLFGSRTECETLANGIHMKREAVLGCKVKDEGRKLLVLINPVAGQGKGQAVYREIVEPLFLKCKINTDVIVTHRKKQMTVILQESDLEEYDGIVVIGGDGTVNEALSGYLLRCMTEADRDVKDYRCDIIPTRMPFGVINAGSGDWFASHLHGTRDVTTCTLHIIRGSTMRLGASTTHEDGELSAFAFLIQHIGFIGDVMRSCELNRWMGPARYKITPSLTLLKRRLLTAKLTMYLADNPEVSPCSDAPGLVTSTVPSANRGMSDKKTEDTAAAELSDSFTDFVTGRSTTILGRVSTSLFPLPSATSVSSSSGTSIDSATWGSLTDAGRGVVRKKYGGRRKPFSWDDMSHTECMDGALYNVALSLTRTDSPINHFSQYLGGDSMHLQVIRKCTFADFVKHLTKLRDNTPGVVNTNNRFVIDRRLKALKMSFTEDSKEQTWYMNCDGDCYKFTSNTCYIRWHPNVLRVFGTPDP